MCLLLRFTIWWKSFMAETMAGWLLVTEKNSAFSFLCRESLVLPYWVFLALEFPLFLTLDTYGHKMRDFFFSLGNSLWFQLDVLEVNSVPALSGYSVRSHRIRFQSHSHLLLPHFRGRSLDTYTLCLICLQTGSSHGLFLRSGDY